MFLPKRKKIKFSDFWTSSECPFMSPEINTSMRTQSSLALQRTITDKRDSLPTDLELQVVQLTLEWVSCIT